MYLFEREIMLEMFKRLCLHRKELLSKLTMSQQVDYPDKVFYLAISMCAHA